MLKEFDLPRLMPIFRLSFWIVGRVGLYDDNIVVLRKLKDDKAGSNIC